MKYTKGEWKLDTQDDSIRANGQLVAQVYGATEHNHEDNATECFANARLILNAPKMLELLEELASYQAHTSPYMKMRVKRFLTNLMGANNE